MQYITKLKNGLTFIHHEMPGCGVVDVRITLRAGTAYNHLLKAPAGTSHFVEHVVHEKTEKYATKEAVTKLITDKGGRRNAATAPNEKMIFFATVLAEESKNAAEYISQVVWNTRITQEAADKHRAIIIQELHANFKQPASKAMNAFKEIAFPGSDLGLHTLGTIESLQGMKLADLEAFYQGRFKPEHAILSIYGGIGLSEAKKLAEAYFSPIDDSAYTGFGIDLCPEAEQFIAATEKRSIHTQISDAQSVVMFGGVDEGRSEEHFHASQLFFYILAGDTNSILHKILREEKQYVYSVKDRASVKDTVGIWCIELNTTADHIQDCLTIIKDQIRLIAEGTLDDEIIRLSKVRIKASETFSQLTPDTKAEIDSNKLLLYPDLRNPDEHMEKLLAVTKEELIESAKIALSQLRLLSVCSNKEETYEF